MNKDTFGKDYTWNKFFTITHRNVGEITYQEFEKIWGYYELTPDPGVIWGGTIDDLRELHENTCSDGYNGMPIYTINVIRYLQSQDVDNGEYILIEVD